LSDCGVDKTVTHLSTNRARLQLTFLINKTYAAKRQQRVHLQVMMLLLCDTVMLLYFHCISGALELWMWEAIASSY